MQPPPQALTKQELQFEIRRNRDFLRRLLKIAFVWPWSDLHAFRHTTAAKSAAFPNDDCDPPLRIESESSFGPGII